MSLLRALKPYLLVSKLFGFSPCTVTSTTITASIIGSIYSVISMFGYLLCSFLKLYWRNKNLNAGTVIRILFRVLPVITDIVTSIFNQRRFAAVVTRCRNFDLKVFQLGRPYRDPIVVYWVLCSGCCGVWFLITLTDYFVNNECCFALIATMFINMGFSFGILRFSIILFSIGRRFKNLNHIAGHNEVPEAFTIMKSIASRPFPSLRHLCQLHGSLVDIAEEFNSIFSFQLLLWLGASLVSFIIRFYQVLIERKNYLYVGTNVTMILAQVLSLAGVSHFVSKEANSLGLTLQSPKARYIMKFVPPGERAEVMLILLLRSLHITAAGFFEVDHSLLLSMAAATTTYLLIAIQTRQKSSNGSGAGTDSTPSNMSDD